MYFHFENRKNPFVCYPCSGLAPEPHLHNDIELFASESGSTVASADLNSVTVEAGDIFVAFPNQIHYYLDGQERPKGTLLIFSSDLLPEYGSIFKKQIPRTPLFRGAGNDPKVRECLQELVKICAENDSLTEEPLARAYLLILFSRLIPRVELIPAVNCDTDALHGVIRFCTENYMKDISLQTMADALHMSRYTISHLFGKRLNVNFCDYINAMRIRRACELLDSGKLSVTEVAYAVGYNSTRSFNRCFSKVKGCTPREYRKRQKKVETVDIPADSC